MIIEEHTHTIPLLAIEPRVRFMSGRGKFLLTIEQFAQLIETAPDRSQIHLSVRNEGTHTDGKISYQGMCAFVDVTRDVALSIARQLLTPSAERNGWRLPVSVKTYASTPVIWFGA